MSMPNIDDDIEELETEAIEDFAIEGNAISLDIDEGDIRLWDGDAKTISGQEALKQWIKKALLTRAYVYEIYDAKSTDEDEPDIVYGSECRDILLDPDRDRLEKMADIQLDIENVLGNHPDIISIAEFEFTQTSRTLTVAFTVTSIYGEDKEEVILNGEDI